MASALRALAGQRPLVWRWRTQPGRGSIRSDRVAGGSTADPCRTAPGCSSRGSTDAPKTRYNWPRARTAINARCGASYRREWKDHAKDVSFETPMIRDIAVELGAMLKARRRSKRLTLRDLSDEIDVSLNTLSRVERGHLPDLKNFQRIVDWLDIPAERFLEPAGDEVTTPEKIARHLRSDERLTREGAAQIAQLVEEMYHNLVGQQPRVAVHLRSARTFTPAAGVLLSDILSDMQSALLSSPPE